MKTAIRELKKVWWKLVALTVGSGITVVLDDVHDTPDKFVYLGHPESLENSGSVQDVHDVQDVFNFFSFLSKDA